MSHVGRKSGKGAARMIASCREMLGPDGAARREQQIAALPRVVWKGRELVTLRCSGTSGKGPHDVNVPEAVAWALIGLRPFFCVYHQGDRWVAPEQEQG